MPALVPTEYYATICWLGRVSDREKTLAAVPERELQVTFEGVVGEAHSGATRSSCSRVSAQYAEGTVIRNVRQLSILAREELDAIAREMGLAQLDPAWLGASMTVEGIADFSHVPPSSRLQAEGGATLVVDMGNRPCIHPGRVIEKAAPGFGAAFKPAAKERRGVTAWVEREGILHLGDRLRLHIPDQRAWAPLATASRAAR